MKMRKQLFEKGLALTILLGIALSAQAGWVETKKDGTQTLIAGGKIKHMPEVPGEPWSVIDISKQTFSMFNPDRNTCSVTAIEEFCEFFKAFSSDDQEGERPPAIEVKKMGPDAKIAGLETVRYQVLVDGRAYEDIWLAKDKTIINEIGDRSALQKIIQCMGESGVEKHPEYVGTITSGWLLKVYSHENEEVTEEVKNLEKKDIPNAEFDLPSGCRRVGLLESMGGE
ncbi:MAG: DUF4412 domain-containing protein [Desulfobulbaceae bacterium]|nr:DUF4412 domain-containing protein [Desulfobulbaceae bacterium]